MLPIFLMLVAVAVGSILIYVRAAHEISRLLAIAAALFCLIFGFAMAPWPIQMAVFGLILSLERVYSLGETPSEP
jgi:hypothetical protein